MAGEALVRKRTDVEKRMAELARSCVGIALGVVGLWLLWLVDGRLAAGAFLMVWGERLARD